MTSAGQSIMLPDPATLHVIQLTPPGRGAIATLRIEGPGAADVVQAHFHTRQGRPLTAYPIDRPVVGHFAGDRGEEVVVRRCAAGAAELHCHGGFATVTMIEETLIAAGCERMTWRDWTTGRCADPIAAAALVALADARTERTAAILLDQYHGALGLRAGCNSAVARLPPARPGDWSLFRRQEASR